METYFIVEFNENQEPGFFTDMVDAENWAGDVMLSSDEEYAESQGASLDDLYSGSISENPQFYSIYEIDEDEIVEKLREDYYAIDEETETYDFFNCRVVIVEDFLQIQDK